MQHAYFTAKDRTNYKTEKDKIKHNYALQQGITFTKAKSILCPHIRFSLFHLNLNNTNLNIQLNMQKHTATVCCTKFRNKCLDQNILAFV